MKFFIFIVKLIDFLWRCYVLLIAIKFFQLGDEFKGAVLLCLWSICVCLAYIAKKAIQKDVDSL